MLQQDLQPDEDQDDAPHGLRLLLVAAAELVADQNAGQGDHKGNTADYRYGRADLHIQKRKGNAHGQSVNAGGDGQDQELLDAEIGGRCVLPFAVQGFPEHLTADVHQQHKGDPVVVLGDVLFELLAQGPA